MKTYLLNINLWCSVEEPFNHKSSFMQVNNYAKRRES